MLPSIKRRPRYWLLYKKHQKRDEMLLFLYLTLSLLQFDVKANSKT